MKQTGLATPELYKLCEKLGADYVIRLKASAPAANAHAIEDEITSEKDTTSFSGRLHTKQTTGIIVAGWF